MYKRKSLRDNYPIIYEKVVAMNSQFSSQTTRQNILMLLDKLPPENLLLVETFIRFVRDQQLTTTMPFANSQAFWRYPTVPVAAASLDNLIGIMPDIGGDALADTESLYDEV